MIPHRTTTLHVHASFNVRRQCHSSHSGSKLLPLAAQETRRGPAHLKQGLQDGIKQLPARLASQERQTSHSSRCICLDAVLQGPATCGRLLQRMQARRPARMLALHSTLHDCACVTTASTAQTHLMDRALRSVLDCRQKHDQIAE